MKSPFFSKIVLSFTTCLFLQSIALSESSPFRIGVCLALTGEASKWSEAQLDGMKLAVEDYKEKGIPINFTVEDTGTSAAGSVKCFQRIWASHQPQVIIGNIWGYLTTPLIPLAQEKRIPLISPAVSRLTCPKDSQFFFSVSEQVQDLQPTFKEFFQKKPDVKKIAILAFDDPEWGDVNRHAVEEAAKSQGVSITEALSISDLQFNFRTVLPRILAKKPDAIFVFHEPLSSTKAIRELGYQGIIVQSNSIGEQLWGVEKADPVFENVHFGDMDLPEWFQKKFRDLFHREAILDAHSGYDAITVAITALQKNLDHPELALQSALLQGVKGEEINFQKSCAGKQSHWSMFVIRGGKKTPL